MTILDEISRKQLRPRKDPSFHLWRMKNLVKYQKFSKYYNYRCRH